MKPILEINQVSKKFNIQATNKPYLSLRESLFNFSRPSSKKEDFWALKDVSFNVMPGDTVGIIGKNGAGKSTLLKIFSKITPPTSGKITGRGHIASLLEVGTGFHPELSGRENVLMNGSILGMRKIEILKKFDAIVDFSGVEQFIDTPLKHYSSGMQLRLAFAVAAFLENEILIVDEVLAVGDVEFQKKCMGKMGDVSKSGRTILFVSHNMGAVAQLCKKGIVLQKGNLVHDASIAECINAYLKPDENTTNLNGYVSNPLNKKHLAFSSIFTFNSGGVETDVFSFSESIHIKMVIGKTGDVPKDTKLSITLLDKFQARVSTVVKTIHEFKIEAGSITINVEFPHSFIAPNLYSLRYAIFNDKGEVFDLLEDITKIKIIDTGSSMAYYEGVDYGSVIMNCNWK